MPIDYKRYPQNWKTEIVPAVLKRAGNCCEFCHLPNGAQVWSVPFTLKAEDGKYKSRRIWFSNIDDAFREASDTILIDPVKVVITVAHLDHDEENHKVTIDRLRALCQACHLRYDVKEKYRRSFEKWGK